MNMETPHPLDEPTPTEPRPGDPPDDDDADEPTGGG